MNPASWPPLAAGGESSRNLGTTLLPNSLQREGTILTMVDALNEQAGGTLSIIHYWMMSIGSLLVKCRPVTEQTDITENHCAYIYHIFTQF